jgi:hypothetical protein
MAAIAQWLDEAAMTCWQQIHASNFDAEAHDAYKILGIAGWFVLFEDWDENTSRLYFEQWPISQCYAASSRPGNRVDTLFREFSMSAGALVEWAREKGGTVSAQVLEMVAGNKQDEQVQLLWAIEPRSDFVPGSKVSTRLPFASVTIELQTMHTIKESGYHEFPCAVPRWMRLPNSVYAMGPWYHLVDSRGLVFGLMILITAAAGVLALVTNSMLKSYESVFIVDLCNWVWA